MVNFPARGKGPLQLPRLSSIGPMSEASEKIGKLVFRGSNLEGFNGDEFRDNTITGRPVDVWILDSAAVAKRYDLTPSETRFSLTATNTEAEQKIIDEFRIGFADINEFGVDTGRKEVLLSGLEDNGLIARHISEQVTGGISSNVGAGFRFAGTGGVELERRAPLVLFLEKNRIPARFTKVQYTDQFINEHPELAGAADNGGRMLMAPHLRRNYDLGDFEAWYGMGEFGSRSFDPENLKIQLPDDALMVQWFNPLSSFFDLEPEQELFAHTSEIDLDQSLFAVCFYTGRKRLNNLYRNEIGNPKNVSIREQTEAMHDVIADRMIANSDRLVTCVLKGELRTQHDRVPIASFHSFYDGKEFTENYDKAIPFTDPTRF